MFVYVIDSHLTYITQNIYNSQISHMTDGQLSITTNGLCHMAYQHKKVNVFYQY